MTICESAAEWCALLGIVAQITAGEKTAQTRAGLGATLGLLTHQSVAVPVCIAVKLQLNRIQ